MGTERLYVPDFYSALFNVDRPTVFKMGLHCGFPLVNKYVNNTITNTCMCCSGLATLKFNAATFPKVTVTGPTRRKCVGCVVTRTVTVAVKFMYAIVFKGV